MRSAGRVGRELGVATHYDEGSSGLERSDWIVMRANQSCKGIFTVAIGLVAASAFGAPARFDLTGEIPISAVGNKAFINRKGWVAAQTSTGPRLW